MGQARVVSVKRFMIRVVGFGLGIVIAIWYSFVFPALFPYLFLDVSLDPVVGGCLESVSRAFCTFLAAALLWGMALPLNIVVLTSGAIAAAVIYHRVFGMPPNVWWVIVGHVAYIVSVIVFSNYESADFFSWHSVTMAITHSLLIAVGLCVGTRLTSRLSSLWP